MILKNNIISSKDLFETEFNSNLKNLHHAN